MRHLVLAASIAVFAVHGWAQNGGKSEVFTSQQIRAQLATLATKAKDAGTGGLTLADYGSHKVQLSVRTTSGAAEVHAHYDDVMIVEQGSATIITGGTVLNPKTGEDGETKGTGIEGGTSHTISQGDIVTVHAGVAHQILIASGTTYGALVIKVKEP